jgi:hypothetical protein
VDAALDRFEHELRPAVRGRQAAGRRMASFVVPPTVVHNWRRDAFLNAARAPLLSGLRGRVFAPSLESRVKGR